MPLYVDPTEIRSNSRLPPAVVAQSISLPGLEAVTGADLLISINKAPDDIRVLKGLSITDLKLSPGETARKCNLPLSTALTAHAFLNSCNSGLLVQRKTGRDLPSSIPHFTDILVRMLSWTSRPWLLGVLDLKCSRKGMAVVDGDETKWSFNSVQGALEAWQLRGGYISILNRDSLVAPWIARWLDKLRISEPETILAPRGIVQPIVGPDSGIKPWRSTLMSFPDMGLVLANRISENNATLASCLEWITCPDWLLQESISRPHGIGPPTIRRWRRWMGLNEDCLQMLVAAIPGGHEAHIELKEINDDV